MNKLEMIEMCIQNDLRAIEELKAHLAKLQLMKEEELLKEATEDEPM